jgi:GMP synthase (glutamine-hydrolysing)
MEVKNKILILDFGSQYTQLIARRVRELQVYCEIHPYYKIPNNFENEYNGIILSGSPCSVNDLKAPTIDLITVSKLPLLGICYGAQLIAHQFQGKVFPSKIREYGRAKLEIIKSDKLFLSVSKISDVWMSHGDTITELPENFEIIAKTESIPVAAFKIHNQDIYGIQFHPEVTHTLEGKQIIKNFVLSICSCEPNWTSEAFIEATVHELKKKIGEDKVVLGLSGGVDSTVAAVLINKAIGNHLTCIFVDNGLLRKNEFYEVLDSYKGLGLNVIGVDAKQYFYNVLKGKIDPEEKRKAIGKAFIDVFEKEAKKIKGVKWLAQGTIYPDVIESVSVNGPSVTIKSHHNVGGLPETMNLKVIEPLRLLFKDEVRLVGKSLGISSEKLNRHPFPGPGLAIRIIGEVTPQAISILQEVDYIFIQMLKEYNLYEKVWQAAAILLPIHSVGVMGDERTYEKVVALRAVASQDGMTADWYPLPYEFLAKVSNEIINKVRGINRVVYDISSKPPATIEWE